jgi:ParB family transcriptional regulator, chromosome partitioning protein
MVQKKGLGRGLSALMADVRTDDPSPQAEGGRRTAERAVPIETLRPNPNQPRRSFDLEKLEELAASIREFGIIQPLVVRAGAEGYEIVAGERRWRAAQLAQLHEVPVLVRDYDATEMFQIAVVENVQRADLNPMDEANAYWTLVDRFGHSQNEVADAVGKSRSHVANMIRLRELPPKAQALLEEGKLTIGHVRPLIGLANAEELAAKILARGLSVREVEKLVAAEKPASVRKPREKAVSAKDADTLALEGDLSAALKMQVQIEQAGAGGKLIVSYASLDELDRLCNLLSAIGSNIFAG